MPALAGAKGHTMLKLIIGLKGTGKTKHMIELVNEAVTRSKGSVVCIERNDKLRYDIKYQCRLIPAEEYLISDAYSLYGFVSGIYASNHDITDIFIDSALRICGEDKEAFDVFLDKTNSFANVHGINVTISSTIDFSDATETMKKYII